MTTIAVALGAVLLVWAAVVAGFAIAGRREWARAIARLVPDCVVLLRRLLADDRVPRRHKVLLWLLLAYLLFPLDLVPDVIPVAGQLDDAVVACLALRAVVRGAGASVVRDSWPGPPETLRLVLQAAGVAA
jgi:uncharacterized membrane protein YkvA (DUF1232 family)